ncbi:MAG: hypothetical protein ACE5K7_04680 [Phycisphaerae bacterium]
MNPQDQAILLLKVVINIAPVAVYFVVLGLVNSQPRPKLVSGRSDFVALTLVFVPMLVWPVPVLLAHHLWWLLVLGLVVGVGGFAWLLPSRGTSWVIYNIGETRCRRCLEAALSSLGIRYRREQSDYVLADEPIRIHVSAFGLLRNVTLHFDLADPVPWSLLARLQDSFRQRLDRVVLLPSGTGPCLLALGVGLLMLPLWMISNHMDAIVEVITRLLFA